MQARADQQVALVRGCRGPTEEADQGHGEGRARGGGGRSGATCLSSSAHHVSREQEGRTAEDGGDDGGGGGGGGPEGHGVVHGEPCGHAGHAGLQLTLHEGVHSGVQVYSSAADSRLLRMGPFLHEAHP